MKSLHDYLIQEKLKINKNTVKSRYDKSLFRQVYFPKIEYIDEWSTFEPDDTTEMYNLVMPTKKWIIYSDEYRHTYYHFASLGDFFITAGLYWGEEDFEDYTPDKTIHYQSDDLYDAMKWYMNELIENKLLTYDNRRNLYIKTEAGDKQVYDSSKFIDDVLNGNLEEEDLILGLRKEYAFPNEKDFDNFPKYMQDLIDSIL